MCSGMASAQSPYWQQEVDYRIHATLSDTAHAIDGIESMIYHNNSPDSLHFIWIHLWPNAYKNDRTAFSDQLLENGSTAFYFSPEDKRGYINRLAFKVNGIPAEAKDHPQHQDIVQLMLNRPLAPSDSIKIETPFHVKLPFPFSRSGYYHDAYQVTQWYPKPAVYDSKGWHEMPYLDQGEFYSEFGNYDVTITLPASYMIAATGKGIRMESEDTMQTMHYHQADVHDFAWFASKHWVMQHDTLQLRTKVIDVYTYHKRSDSANWKNSIRFVKQAILTKSAWLGEYPFDIASVVENATNTTAGSGMEYPTITTIENTGSEKDLDIVINHEVGHNWFYGTLATNERQYPWMDEGMNSFYDNRYAGIYYGNAATKPGEAFLKKRMPRDFERTILNTILQQRTDQPISTAAANFSDMNYSTIAYTKAAAWMALLERSLGTSTFDSCMQAYYQQWKFRHPYPSDFKRSMEQASGKSLDNIFVLLDRKGYLKQPPKKDIRFSSFFNIKDADKHTYISLLPAAGFNFYDKLMLGGILHNYSLPLSALRFVAVPLYAAGSRQINGIGRAAYSFFPGKSGSQLALSASYARFTSDSFKDSTGKKNYQPYSKLVPSIRYIFSNRDSRSTLFKYIQWKTFLIRETGLLFQRDTANNIDLISYPVAKRTINQLCIVVENSRVLYPYRAVLQADQGKGFVRIGLTGNYYFNYAKKGGLNLRLFAGKFMYTGDKTFIREYETDRYHLNLTGANGYEDYTYSGYFYGRNEFEGLGSQQIMIRDGGFKVRTDLLSQKIGKTDDWLAAININTDIPAAINPLGILPIKIPLKLFADAGTYAEAWNGNAGTGRFLYDAGLQLSLLNNSINIYLPLLYSKVYDDYYKSTITEKRFAKKLSFSVDLEVLNIKRLFPRVIL